MVAILATLSLAQDDAIVVRRVPEIARFFGIVSKMFWREHGPPHFHAAYSGYEVAIDIDTAEIHGEFPARAARLVLEWRDLHKRGLLENWQLARMGSHLERIAPLE